METTTEKREKIRYGLVAVSNGKSRPLPLRLRLSPDSIILQKEDTTTSSESLGNKGSAHSESVPSGAESPCDSRIREVKVVRQRTGGLGFSIKGGAEHRLPILVSRIVKGQAADQTGQLFVGDALLRVNGRVITSVTHEEAVNILRNAGNEAVLTVKHYRAATPFLQKTLIDPRDDCPSQLHPDNGWRTAASLPPLPLPPSSPTSKHHLENDRIPRCSQSSSNECLPGSDQSLSNSSGSITPSSGERKWENMVSVPLMLAYFTRYIFGTDKLRPNAFEVRGVNGVTTGIVHCEDAASLSQWMKHITDNIVGLTNLQITLHNRGLPPSDRILYMSWVSEGLLHTHQLWQNWQPCFMALKGCQVFLFPQPPHTSEDWNQCPLTFSLHQSLLRILKASENVDERQHCFLLQTLDSAGALSSHYLSVETRQELLRLESAWHRAVGFAVHRLGTKSFEVTSENRSWSLTIDLGQGFGLYDDEAKSYSWQYKFSQLKGSSDDGKCCLRLHFQHPETKKIDIREMYCEHLQSLLFCMHAFLTAKVASVDPSFLSSSANLTRTGSQRKNQ